MASVLEEYRQLNPQDADLTDQQVADGLYMKWTQKTGQELPRDQFDFEIGYHPQQEQTATLDMGMTEQVAPMQDVSRETVQPQPEEELGFLGRIRTKISAELRPELCRYLGVQLKSVEDQIITGQASVSWCSAQKRRRSDYYRPSIP